MSWKGNLASGERLDEATADPPAPRSRPGPQLMGPPRSKLLDLDMQIQGCLWATQRVQKEPKW